MKRRIVLTLVFSLREQTVDIDLTHAPLLLDDSQPLIFDPVHFVFQDDDGKDFLQPPRTQFDLLWTKHRWYDRHFERITGISVII